MPDFAETLRMIRGMQGARDSASALEMSSPPQAWGQRRDQMRLLFERMMRGEISQDDALDAIGDLSGMRTLDSDDLRAPSTGGEALGLWGSAGGRRARQLSDAVNQRRGFKP